MGLDVWLYQFKGLNTDAILKLSQFSEEPWASGAFQKWKTLPESDRGPFPSEADRIAHREKLAARARELGIPEKILKHESFGGEHICFPSKANPQMPVGDWYSFSMTQTLMKHFIGKDIYFAFPEAGEDLHYYFKPDWAAAKGKLSEILKELKKVEPAELEKFCFGLSESFDHHLNQIEVMIETMDYVLSHPHPEEFLLCWSD
ncbi:MAG TPA: hypothetical protein VK815_11690 [Candidatus Acidoferrales bacterium]|jgi:hypothetical protein|nr:hypothetical protein [Candidatus Acidoferrales bacterium]